MNIAFRVDSSSQIGTGHVRRCLVIAESLRDEGVMCSFFCRELSGNLISHIRGMGFPVVSLCGDELIDLSHIQSKENKSKADPELSSDISNGHKLWDWLIIDHYDIGTEWENNARKICHKIAVIDDILRVIHDCDLLIVPTPLNNNRKKILAKRYTKNIKILQGPSSIILRNEFDIERSKIISSYDLSQLIYPRVILVMFGGDDHNGDTIKVASAILNNFNHSLKLKIVVSPINVHTKKIRDLYDSEPSVEIYCNPPNIAKIMSAADLVVGSGGSSTWEILYLRKPALLKITASNQEESLLRLKKTGHINLFSSINELVKQLNKVHREGILPSPDLVGNGTHAITNLIKNNLVQLKKVTPLDIRNTYKWLSSDKLRRNIISCSEKPSRVTHFRYWRNALSDSSRIIYSVYYADVHIGNAGLLLDNERHAEAELWLYIGSESYQGKRLGSIILRQLEDKGKDIGILQYSLHVSVSNRRAFSLYKKIGFTYAQDQDSASKYKPSYPDVIRMTKSV